MFGLGINASVPQPLPANDTVASAQTIDMNEAFNGALAGPLDSAYYFFPLRNGQTTAMLTANFNPATQQVSYRSAQKTGANTYLMQPEVTLSASQASGAQVYFTSGYPANTASTTSPAGVMVRLSGTNPAGASNQAFALRLGVRAVTLVGFDITNTENITRWFPTTTATLQAATYITSKLGVKDQNGQWVKNHPVQLTVQRFSDNANTQQIATYRTNLEGKMALNAVLATSGAGGQYPIVTTFSAGCSGNVLVGNNYGPPGSPRDHWNGTAQNASVNALLLGASPVVQNQTTFTIKFTRICSETYLGYY